MYLIVSSHISLFILCIDLLFWFIYWCNLHCLEFIYPCLTITSSFYFCLVQFSSFQSHLFSSPIGARTLFNVLFFDQFAIFMHFFLIHFKIWVQIFDQFFFSTISNFGTFFWLVFNFIPPFLQFFPYENCRNCQHYCAFTVVQYFKETWETVHSIQKETCDKVTRFKKQKQVPLFREKKRTWIDAHECDLGLGKLMEHFHFLSGKWLRRRKGPAVPERDLQKMDGRKIALGHGLSNHEDARDEFSCTSSSGKTRRREDSV